jgi:hypothetical protein
MPPARRDAVSTGSDADDKLVHADFTRMQAPRG